MTLPTTQLIHGDCLEAMPTLQPDSVQMVFADLPYAVTDNAWDVSIDLPLFWRETGRVGGSDAPIVLTASQPAAARFISSNIKQFRYDLIWLKTRATGHFHARYMPMRAHEQILIFNKSARTYNAQKTKTTKLVTGTKTSNARSANWQGKLYERKPWTDTGERHPLSYLLIKSNRNQNSVHPTQKPVALLEWLIRTYTNQGDTVLDPVMGSGTTGVACLRTGRNFIGIEKESGYFDVATKRIAAERARLEAS